MKLNEHCELCGKYNILCSECGNCLECGLVDEFSTEQLAQLAARHGLILLPETPTTEILSRMKMATSVTVGAQTYHPNMENSYKAMIEAGKVK